MCTRRLAQCSPDSGNITWLLKQCYIPNPISKFVSNSSSGLSFCRFRLFFSINRYIFVPGIITSYVFFLSCSSPVLGHASVPSKIALRLLEKLLSNLSSSYVRIETHPSSHLSIQPSIRASTRLTAKSLISLNTETSFADKGPLY